jgi:hypothetical protein
MAPNLGCTDSLHRTDLFGEHIKAYRARPRRAAFEAGIGESLVSDGCDIAERIVIGSTSPEAAVNSKILACDCAPG